jgi:hypothetical protein
MSYASIGSYYEFTPHEIFPATSGVGEYYELPVAGYGEYYELPVAGYGAFGAEASFFDVQTILNNVAKSDACYGPGGACWQLASKDDAGKAACAKAQGPCNFAGQKVGKDMQAALNQLGYGPMAVDGTLSWEGPYKRFLSDFDMSPGPGYGITKAGLLKMKQQLEKGAAPGPGKKVVHKKVNGEFIPIDETVDENGDSKANIMIGLGVLAVAALVVGVAVARNKGRTRRDVLRTRSMAAR